MLFYIRLCNVIIGKLYYMKLVNWDTNINHLIILEHWKSHETMHIIVFGRRMSRSYFQFWLFLAKINKSYLYLRNIQQAKGSLRMSVTWKNAPRRGIEPRSPAWQAGILTTILSWSLFSCMRLCVLNLLAWVLIKCLILKVFKIFKQIDFIM